MKWWTKARDGGQRDVGDGKSLGREADGRENWYRELR
jgi:hypothetical protein